MGAGLKFSITDRPDGLEVRLDGSIDEDSGFERIVIPKGKPVFFYLTNVGTINSTGIREWLNWTKSYQDEGWHLNECPTHFINQLNMIDQFVPPKSKVVSFFVPFFSDELNEEKIVLVDRASCTNGTLNVETPKDSQGNEMDIDVIPEHFLKFTKKH
jgi:hypothetical protein